ncbi:glycosyltransferase family 4 protein [Prevotella communis]|uniref:glycosyltransferase family 4 protein n=1 Tax=Prevotella communis TaxID=2913614 RepID=UPI001EDAF1B7|nr:glycosyltransferase family 4 protein [Prevotella communis]UKK68374.1 glycosyltransferase family 4 protein [Prevotella communis]UKK69491.1 glycosyltransferase family 4 protein [Prevotella communis]
MKITYIYTALVTRGGADRVITNKANWLAEHGYDVMIVTDTQLGREPIYPLSPKVVLHDLAIDFSLEYGHSLPVRAWWYFKLMRQYRKKLTEVLMKRQSDVVITTLGRDLDFLTKIKDGSVKIGESHIARQFSRNFHLMEQKGGLHKMIAQRWRKKQEKDVSKLDALVLLTREDANSWKGVTNTFVIPNPTPFYPEESSTCESHKAICVGRLNEQKGYVYLIDAWTIVSKRHPDWILNAYGSGEIKEQLQMRIDEKGVSNSLILNEPTSDIIGKYLESSIYIMSSRFEGFPMVLLEAMSCGLPCVSFDCPNGAKDIIEDGRNGFLVEYLNVNALAESICKLIEDESLRKKLGQTAKEDVMMYLPDSIMKLWIDLFNLHCRKNEN